MKKTIQDVLKEISEALEDADGDFVAGIYNQLSADQIMYVGDSMFEPVNAN